MKTKGFILLAIAALSAAFAPQTESSYKVDASKSVLEWKGKKIGGEHYGNIAVTSGEILVKGDEIVGGSFIIDMNSITCTDIKDEGTAQKLIGHLKSDDFFGVEAYPQAKLVITSASKTAKGKYDIKADITVKGITKPIEFKALLTIGEKLIIAEASLFINRALHDVKYGSSSFFQGLGDKAISDEFEVKVKLQANK